MMVMCSVIDIGLVERHIMHLIRAIAVYKLTFVCQ